MSSHESREESCTDPNEERGRTCDNCGKPITHTVVAGPGVAKHSCGCDAQPMAVADDTPNALANSAIRALNADGDVETAAEVYEGTRGRLVADGGNEPIPHDQYEHIAEARDALRKVDDREVPDDVAEFVENAYSKFDWWHDRVEDDPELVTDGGVPETFDDLAGTCESCGDDVDADRLIEGECPGCHYHEPVADGGFHTVTRDGQEFAVVRWQEFDEDDEMEIGPDGAIENYDEIGQHTTVRLISADAIREQQMEDRVIGPGDTGWREEYAELELGESIVPDHEDEEPIADGGTAWTDLTGFKRDMLAAIRRLDNEGETVYGLAIKRELEHALGTEIHHGRLYPNLDDLVDAGLVEKSELDKRTNEYELTDAAEAMLEQRARHLADACGMEQPVADGGDQA